MSPDEVRQCRAWADIYRERGFNPLPSRTDEKRPLVKFADHWEKPFPKEEFEKWETSNLQLMTGRHWGLLAIDLDGSPAREWWARTAGSLPRTWITHSSGDGLHLWFAVPRSYSSPLPKAILWKGEGPHEAVERLCDRSLLMAPPSIHPKTGKRYQFLARNAPRNCPIAPCPRWLLDMEPVATARVDPAVLAPIPRAYVAPTGERYDLAAVLDSIPDKSALAREWGLRVVGRGNERGWVECRAINRTDQHPSAAIHRDSGVYVDQGSGIRLRFFDLAATIGPYRDWKEAVSGLGDRFIGRRRAQ